MSTAVAPVSNPPVGAVIERALLTGDLSSLTVDQRLSYYNRVCQSLGLNPLTRPFDYIVLNNKLTLYAKRDCTDQLRKIHGVSIDGMEPRQLGSIYVVVVSAKDRDLRTDQSTGAVSIVYPARFRDHTGTWKDHPRAGQTFDGEDLGNAMMKAETKAKRRVTLSICGLGMLDETEIADIPDARDPLPPPEVVSGERKPVQTATEAHTAPRPPQGIIYPPQGQTTQEPPPAAREQATGDVVITERQGKMLFAIQRSVGISDEQCKRALSEIGYTGHRDQLPKRMFQQALDVIDPEFRFHTREGR